MMPQRKLILLRRRSYHHSVAFSARSVRRHTTVLPLGPVEQASNACLLQGSFKEGELLMRHQRRALAWMLRREKGQPAGGILADDQGLVRIYATNSSHILERQQVPEPKPAMYTPDCKYKWLLSVNSRFSRCWATGWCQTGIFIISKWFLWYHAGQDIDSSCADCQ